MIADNIYQGKDASVVYDIAKDSAARFSDPSHFWRRLAELVAEHTPKPANKPSPPVAMTDAEAAGFERSCRIEFGQHAGNRIADVPLAYLCWLADQRFLDNLRRYLRSPRIQAEITEDL